MTALPKGFGHVRRDAGDTRAALERAAIQRDGRLTAEVESLINLAVRHETKAQVVGTLFRRDFEKLTPTERLSYLSAVTEASEARDRAIRALQLDTSPASGREPNVAAAFAAAIASRSQPAAQPEITADYAVRMPEQPAETNGEPE